MSVSLTALSLTPAPVLDKAHQDLKKAAQGFESYFLNLMFQEMRKTVPQDGMLGESSNQHQVFQNLLDQTLADSMSQRGDLGISKLLYDQLAPTLGASSPQTRSLKPSTNSADNQNENF